jgi:putative salt-induced outer membrane protein
LREERVMQRAGMAAALALGVLASGTASADWSGKGSFGGVLARGNTETETINLNLDVENRIAPWTHKFGASMLRTVTDDITSADRWELRGETNYDLTERSYLFGTLRYEDDAFTDFSYQATAAGGYGYRFIMTERTKLEGQIGAGYRQAELRLTGEQEDGIIARGAVNFEHKLTDTTLLYERFLVESGSDNTFVQNQLGIEVKIADTFALGLDYAVRHNTDVLPGTDKTDQVFTANLVYGF